MEVVIGETKIKLHPNWKISQFAPSTFTPETTPSGASPTAVTGQHTLGITGATGRPTSRATLFCATPRPVSLCLTR